MDTDSETSSADEFGLKPHERILYDEIREQAPRQGIPAEAWLILARYLPLLDLNALTVSRHEAGELLDVTSSRVIQMAGEVQAQPWMKPIVHKRTSNFTTDRIWLRAFVEYYDRIRPRR